MLGRSPQRGFTIWAAQALPGFCVLVVVTPVRIWTCFTIFWMFILLLMLECEWRVGLAFITTEWAASAKVPAPPLTGWQSSLAKGDASYFIPGFLGVLASASLSCGCSSPFPVAGFGVVADGAEVGRTCSRI